MREITYRFGDFQLSPARFQLTRKDQELHLEKKPLELLLLMARNQGRVVTRDEIAAHLWGERVFVDTEHGINTAVRKLRVALGESSDQPCFLQTVTGLGYRFVGPIETVELPETSPASAPLPSDPPPSTPALEPLTSAAPPHPAPTRQLHVPRWTFLALLCLGVSITLVAALHLRHAAIPAAQQAGPAPAAAASAVPEEAREQLQRGAYLLDRRNAAGSTAAFRRAVELAPQYAAAYAGLAQSLDAQAKLSDGIPGSYIPEAVAAARQAIALDPASDSGYVALGSIQTAFTWEWRDAEHNLLTGLRLNPRNAAGHIWYAVLLQGTGREQEAVEQANLAVSSEPLSFFAVRMLGSVLYYARRYDEAEKTLQRAEEMTPQHPNVVDNWIALVDEQRGLYDDAVNHSLLSFQQTLPAAQVADLRSAYDRAGWHGFWELRTQQLSHKTLTGCELYTAGVAFLRLGDPDRAYPLLHAATRQHCFWMGMARVDPALDPLRHDPRFPAILSLVNTPESPKPAP